MNFICTATTSVILAGGLLGGSYLLSKFQLNLKNENLSRGYIVKGYAARTAFSDIGQCSLSLSVCGASIDTCYTKMESFRSRLFASLQKAGVADSEIETFALSSDPIYKLDEKGNRTNVIDYHVMFQTVKVTSRDVKLIAALPASVSELYQLGIDLRIGAPEFYISNLDKIKEETLALATINAKERALALAENGGGKVGALRKAVQGIFQVTPPLSTDISDYGEYNTSTIPKAIKAVVSLEYQIAE